MAAEALSWLGKKGNRKEIVEALTAATSDKDERLRTTAKQALKLITGK
jgi:hypothetical protein